MNNNVIYCDFLSHCRPVKVPGDWGRMCPETVLSEPPREAAAMMAALVKAYGEAALLRSGLIVRAGGKCELDSRLEQLDSLVLPLRAAPAALPFELLVEEGTIGGRFPLTATLADHETARGIDERNFLLVVFSLADLAAFRALGLPAAPATGLDQLSPDTIAAVLALLSPAEKELAAPPAPLPAEVPAEEDLGESAQATAELPGEAAAETAFLPLSCDPPRLIIVGWSPAIFRSERPQLCDALAGNLARFRVAFAPQAEAVLVWRPTLQELRRIALCVRSGLRDATLQAVLESIDHSAAPVRIAGEPRPAVGLLEARRRFQEVARRPHAGRRQLRRCQRDLERAFEETFVDPLLAAAAKETFAPRRIRYLAVAETSRLFHSEATRYAAQLQRALTARDARGSATGPDAKSFVKLGDLLLRLTQERRW